MKISWEPITLTLQNTFKIARSKIGGERFNNVIVILEHEGVTGWGETAPFIIYGTGKTSGP